MAGYNYHTSTYNESVPVNGHVYLHYPLEDAQSGHVNQGEAELVVGGKIIPEGEFAIEFDEATTTITVQNRTAEDWPPHTDVVVTVPSDLNSDGVLGTLADHEARIAALEAVVAAATAAPDVEGSVLVERGKKSKAKDAKD